MADVGLNIVADSATRFNNNFFKAVSNENPGDLITSSLSVQVILAMAAYGANGTTAAQMRSALVMPADDEVGQSGYKALIELLNDPKGVELRLANKMYTTVRVPVNSAYKEFTEKKFLSASQEVDFNNARATAEIINLWCEEQTNKRIKDVITPDSLGPDTSLVLVNAVYFKGQWENKFNSSLTKYRPFHVNGTSTIDVPTMFISRNLRTGDLPELRATFVEIPYQGREISMIVIRPNMIDGLKTVLDNIHKFNPNDRALPRRSRDVELYLPKFKIERTLDLQGPLRKLGMHDMFQQNANFSGIAEAQFMVSKVLQKAFIEVNEEGTEAAAVTAVVYTTTSLDDPLVPVVFRVDRPFYYVLYHNRAKLPLFAGVVYKPNAS